MDGFVTAIVKATGRTARIPAHWVDHPVFGPRYEEPAEVPVGVPTEDWLKADIAAYAEARGIDLTGHKASKAAMVAVIDEHTAQDVLDEQDEHESPDADQATDETPATGREKE